MNQSASDQQANKLLLVNPLVASTYASMAAVVSLLVTFTLPVAFLISSIVVLTLLLIAGHNMGTALAISAYHVTRKVHNFWLSAIFMGAAGVIAVVLFNMYAPPSTGNDHSFGWLLLVGFAGLVIPIVAGFLSLAVVATRRRRSNV